MLQYRCSKSTGIFRKHWFHRVDYRIQICWQFPANGKLRQTLRKWVGWDCAAFGRALKFCGESHAPLRCSIVQVSRKIITSDAPRVMQSQSNFNDLEMSECSIKPRYLDGNVRNTSENERRNILGDIKATRLIQISGTIFANGCCIAIYAT